jgi:hypothetical protein
MTFRVSGDYNLGVSQSAAAMVASVAVGETCSFIGSTLIVLAP